MGALSAFLRGVTGPGFSGVSQSMARQAELDQARAQREADMAAEREWRSQEAEKNRVAREELQAMRAGPGAGSGLGGTRRGALSDPDAMYEVRRTAALDGLMRQGMTRPEAEAIVNGADTGVNPLTRPTQTVEQLDDGDRQRNVTVNGSEPDVQRFKALVSQVGKYYAEAVSRSTSNFQQLKAGEQTEFQTDSGRSAQVEPGRAGALGQGVAVSEGKKLFDDGGDNQYTGATGPLTKAKIGAEGALAAERGQKAISEKDKREGKGSIRDEIAVLEGDRKSLAVQLADTRAREALMAKDPTADATEKAAIKARREVLERQATELESNRADLRRKLNGDKPAATDKPAPAPATPKMSAAQIQTALTQARQVIAAKPDQRDEVLRRLRAAGISTAGL